MLKKMIWFLLLLSCQLLAAQKNPGDIWISSRTRYLTNNQAFAMDLAMNTGEKDIRAMHLEIAYDPDYIEPVLSALETPHVFAKQSSPGLVSLSLMNINKESTGSALSLLSLPWRSLQKTGSTAIYITICDVTDADYNSVDATKEIYRRLDIDNNMLGDANRDRVVDIVDSLLVAQWYVGWPPSGFLSPNYDVNCDGRFDIVDALLIAQFYVGLIDEFCTNTEDPVLPGMEPQTKPGDVWIEPKSSLILPGKSFSQEVYIDTGNLNIGAYQITIHYDDNLIKPDLHQPVVDRGEKQTLTAVNPDTPGKIIINGFDTYGISPGRKQLLLQLNWQSLDTLGLCPVNITVEELCKVDRPSDFIAVPLESSAAALEIVEEIRGDVNSDNKLNITDGLILLENRTIITGDMMERLDADCNGVFDIRDSLLIVNYAIGNSADFCDPPLLPDVKELPAFPPIGRFSLGPELHHCEPGDIRIWEISLATGEQDVGSFEVKLSYDPAYIIFDEISAADNINMQCIQEPGSLLISGSAASSDSPETAIASLSFQALGNTGKTDISLKVVKLLDSQGQIMGAPQATASLLKIQDTLLGDAWSDGIINMTDAMTLLYCPYVDFGPCREFNSDLADVNQNGTVDVVDALFISHYLAGLILEF